MKQDGFHVFMNVDELALIPFEGRTYIGALHSSIAFIS
jgi:hypothetical protein